jgi:hypothetical protein
MSIGRRWAAPWQLANRSPTEQRLVVQEYSLETRRFYTRVVENFGKFMKATAFVDVNHFDVREFLAEQPRLGHIRFTLSYTAVWRATRKRSHISVAECACVVRSVSGSGWLGVRGSWWPGKGQWFNLFRPR